MSDFRKLPPQLVAALMSALSSVSGAAPRAAIVVDEDSSVPPREQIAIQIDAIMGTDAHEHAASCENCATNRDELIDHIYNDYLEHMADDADTGVDAKRAAADKKANDNLRRAEQSTNAALGQNEIKKTQREPAAYAAIIRRDDKDVVLTFTVSDSPEKSRAHLRKAEQRMSITFNEFEIKPLYL